MWPNAVGTFNRPLASIQYFITKLKTKIDVIPRSFFNLVKYLFLNYGNNFNSFAVWVRHENYLMLWFVDPFSSLDFLSKSRGTAHKTSANYTSPAGDVWTDTVWRLGASLLRDSATVLDRNSTGAAAEASPTALASAWRHHSPHAELATAARQVGHFIFKSHLFFK